METDAVSAWRQVMQGEAIEDPYACFRRMRAAGAAWRDPYGFLVVTGWSACEQILHDERWGHDLTVDAAQSGRADWWEHPALATDRFVMLRRNGDEHARVRWPMSRQFTARRMAQLQGPVQAETVRLLETVGSDDAVEIVAALALPLPIFVIGELLGVPASDRDVFIPWVRASILEPIFTDAELAAADQAMAQMWEYMRTLIEKRRSYPDEGLVSAFAQTTEGSYSEDELIGNLLLLFGAGFVTTVHMIGSMFALLGERQATQKSLRQGQTTVQAVVEETLRLEAPVQMTARRALTDLDFDGQAVAKGEIALLCLAAANRDPDRFDQPDHYWPDRPDGGLLSFGAGPHFCLGAALARMEGEIVLRSALERFGPWEVLEASRHQTVPFRGFDSVTIRA